MIGDKFDPCNICTKWPFSKKFRTKIEAQKTFKSQGTQETSCYEKYENYEQRASERSPVENVHDP